MNQHINFEDNIFILNIRIRMIQDLLILDTDADIFLSKTMDDLDFVNGSLSSLLLNLKENFRLIDRDEQFHNLLETERQFREVLGELDRGEGNISAIRYPELRERIELFEGQSRDRQHSIEDLITETKHFTMEPVVSRDELHELLGR
ncbi:hypothetical protein AGMMS50230_23120 [Spirochaetia bacterium]|nr:hypothetical protein AGMMS50230_23120 [Spirochaetia bacterium]